MALSANVHAGFQGMAAMPPARHPPPVQLCFWLHRRAVVSGRPPQRQQAWAWPAAAFRGAMRLPDCERRPDCDREGLCVTSRGPNEQRSTNAWSAHRGGRGRACRSQPRAGEWNGPVIGASAAGQRSRARRLGSVGRLRTYTHAHTHVRTHKNGMPASCLAARTLFASAPEARAVSRAWRTSCGAAAVCLRARVWLWDACDCGNGGLRTRSVRLLGQAGPLQGQKQAAAAMPCSSYRATRPSKYSGWKGGAPTQNGHGTKLMDRHAPARRAGCACVDVGGWA